MTSAVAAVEPRNISGRNDCRKLLADAGGGMIPTMGRDRTTSDQFSMASSGEPSPPTKKVLPAQERRHLLPKDLPNALQHLNDEELDRLLTAAVAEAKRRGRSLPSAQLSGTRQRGEGTASLTRGQLNAVRAAFKAGVTPARIARQFGLSHSDVRKALASEASGQGSID
jgi:hypothetical protein